MSLKLIKGFYLEEIHRGKANLGTVRLKPKYARYVQFFFHKKQQNKTKQCVFLYHCSVFAKLVSEYDQEIPQSQTADNPMTLFRFLHLSSVFSTTEQKNGTVCFCITVPCFRTTVPFFVPLFRFLHYCSVFSTMELKRNSAFSYHCSVFAPLFRFFLNRTKNGTVCFCTTVSFFCTIVPFFPQQNKNGTVCFCTTVSFFALLFCFFHNGTKTEQCVFVALFCYCTIVPFFPQQNK